MCLTNASEIKTAEKNILVYKELWFGVTSPYQSYKYTKGLQEKDVKIRVSEIKKVWEGYHTYNNKVDVEHENKVHICIIPKNTKYVNGFYNGELDVKNRASENLYYVGKWTLMNFLKAKFLCIFNVDLIKV
jgi:hypothetical protein